MMRRDSLPSQHGFAEGSSGRVRALRGLPYLQPRLSCLIQRQELFARNSHTVDPDPVPILHTADASWFGVGLVQQSAPALLPLDVLVMILAQELLRRELGMAHSFVLIADSNALRAGASELGVRRAAQRVESVLGRLIDHLGFPARTLRASALRIPETLRQHSCTQLARIGLEVGDRSGLQRSAYVSEQLAQTEAMRRAGARVKLGWTLSAACWDERYFDGLYRRCFGTRGVTFVYTIGGRRLDARRPRACPYLESEATRRLVFGPSEQVADKLAAHRDSPAGRGYLRLLGKIERAHRTLTGRGSPCAEALAQQLVNIGSAGER